MGNLPAGTSSIATQLNVVMLTVLSSSTITIRRTKLLKIVTRMDMFDPGRAMGYSRRVVAMIEWTRYRSLVA